MRFGLFGKNNDAKDAQAEALAAIKAFAKTWLDRYEADPETVVTVNEIACLDPACPGNETIILVMEPGQKTRAVKIAKAAETITSAEVRQAMFPMV